MTIINYYQHKRIRTAYIYIPLITGTLSVIGSGSILYSIWANRSTKLKDPQHRILGMMSIFDIFYSTNAALGFLTYPAGLGVPTYGNTATCSLQGFFTQFGVAAASYNMVLSIYYYLSINRGMKKEEFAKVWEKVMHGIVVIFHLSFAIIGVSMGLYNPSLSLCYIYPGPVECHFDPDVPCRFEEFWYFVLVLAFSLGWIVLAIVVIIVTNLLICLFVRRQEKEMDKYRTRSVAAEQFSEMEKKTSYARSVFVQSMLYVGTFVLSWLLLLLMSLVSLTGLDQQWMSLLVATFTPLQGFFNAFIYARPRYLRLKKKNKHMHMGFKQLIKLVFVPSTSIDDSGPDPSAGKAKKDSNVFKSFLSSLSRKKITASYPAVSETEEAKEETVTRSDSKPMQDAEEGKGKVGEGETSNNGDVSPDEEERSRSERSSSIARVPPTSPASKVTRSQTQLV